MGSYPSWVDHLLSMAATPDFLPPTTPERAAPVAPPVSARPVPASAPAPAPAPAPAYVPPPVLAPPPVSPSDVEAHRQPAEPVAEPLFTIQVWQLGLAVIVVLALVLHVAGLI